ncbi:MAG TPA: DUF4199 domain-containing protein [Vicinamibacterales bacterium]|jgi:hypothetical protein
MRKIVLTFGLIAGAVMSAMFLIAWPFQEQIGFENGMLVGYTSMVAAFLAVYFGVRQYRDQVSGGTITFARALGVGLAITVVASVCYVVMWQIVYYNFMPDFLDKYAAYTLEKERAAGATAAQLEAHRQEMAQFKEMYANPLINAAFTILEPLPVGVLISLISAGVLRRGRQDGALAGTT